MAPAERSAGAFSSLRALRRGYNHSMEATELDTPARPIEQTEEFRQFKDFARHIVAVPKEELDARLAEAEAAKVKKPRKVKSAASKPTPKAA